MGDIWNYVNNKKIVVVIYVLGWGRNREQTEGWSEGQFQNQCEFVELAVFEDATYLWTR